MDLFGHYKKSNVYRNGKGRAPGTSSFITFAVERHTLALELHLLKVVRREACSLFFDAEPQKFTPPALYPKSDERKANRPKFDLFEK